MQGREPGLLCLGGSRHYVPVGLPNTAAAATKNLSWAACESLALTPWSVRLGSLRGKCGEATWRGGEDDVVSPKPFHHLLPSRSLPSLLPPSSLSLSQLNWAVASRQNGYSSVLVGQWGILLKHVLWEGLPFSPAWALFLFISEHLGTWANSPGHSVTPLISSLSCLSSY